MRLLMFDFRESEKKVFNPEEYRDFEIKTYTESIERAKLSDEDYQNTCAISVYRTSPLTKDTLKNFKNIRIISTRSFGFEHIDLDYCTRNNIAVLNVPQYGEEGIAQFSFGIIIALLRKIKQAITDINDNKIIPQNYEGKLLNNLTIGIVGCGRVGKHLAKIANTFKMNVLVSSYKDSPKFDSYCNIVPFDELLSKSDIIALHMPYTTETYQIIGSEEFKKMKNGAYIINTSSVKLINTEALYKNVMNGKILGAGLDILDCDHSKNKIRELGNETMSTGENIKITRELLKLPNVIITPHIAYNTEEIIDYVLETSMNNIRDFLKGMSTNRVC